MFFSNFVIFKHFLPLEEQEEEANWLGCLGNVVCRLPAPALQSRA